MIYHARPASSPFYPACCGRGSGAAPWRRAGRWRWTPTRRRCRCRRRWGWAARWAAASSSRERGGSRCTLKGSMAWSIWLDRILWAIYPTWHAELAGHDKVKNLAKSKSTKLTGKGGGRQFVSFALKMRYNTPSNSRHAGPQMLVLRCRLPESAVLRIDTRQPRQRLTGGRFIHNCCLWFGKIETANYI